MGRLNKRLILGVIAAIGIGMLILNFLPTDKKGKGSGNSPDAVYANDSMPQDVKEMAMRLPEVKLTSAAPLPTSGFGRTSPVDRSLRRLPFGIKRDKADLSSILGWRSSRWRGQRLFRDGSGRCTA